MPSHCAPQRADLHAVRQAAVVLRALVAVAQAEHTELGVLEQGPALHGERGASHGDVGLVRVGTPGVEHARRGMRGEAVELDAGHLVGERGAVVGALDVAPAHGPDQPLAEARHLQVAPAGLRVEHVLAELDVLPADPRVGVRREPSLDVQGAQIVAAGLIVPSVRIPVDGHRAAGVLVHPEELHVLVLGREQKAPPCSCTGPGSACACRRTTRCRSRRPARSPRAPAGSRSDRSGGRRKSSRATAPRGSPRPPARAAHRAPSPRAGDRLRPRVRTRAARPAATVDALCGPRHQDAFSSPARPAAV